MANLIRKLKDKTAFTDIEIIIADYLIEHYRDIANLSTHELAKRTYTSSASIVRFCQKLGFEGYTDF